MTDPVPREIPWDKLSLIRVWKDTGKTQPGWGVNDFMENYVQNAFDPERALRFYSRYGMPFAFVMRSLPLICVDIDGKNGGIPTSRVLNLPPTLAERSKSGNGYHLYYRVPGIVWHPERGYDEFPDVIGLVPGVDIKGTGAVFHYPNQKWNNLSVNVLPPALASLIGRVRDIRHASRLTRNGVESLDEDELILVHDSLRGELHQPLRPGQRNQTLYRVGARMLAAGYPNWESEVMERGEEAGLSRDEMEDLVHSINVYS